MEVFAMASSAVSQKILTQREVVIKNSRPRVQSPSAAKRSLELAFRTFTQAAESLEKSYSHLQAEVLRLRSELEIKNRDLVTSVKENARMREYHTRILQSLPCGVLVVGRDGRLRLANGETRRLLAGGGRISEALTHAQAAIALPEALGELLATSNKHGSVQQECEIRTPLGQRTIGLNCAVLGETQGEGPSGESVFILRDVTEEKQKAAESEAVRRRESLAEMATLLAHEIRNPLGSLELFAGLLADATAASPDLRRWTDHIQAGLRSLSATVNNVLQFHSQPVPQFSPVNLGRLMRESVDFLRPLARQAGLKFDLQNSLGELEIPADAHRLQQVFFNLALNAFRAMAVGGTLTIRLRWANYENFESVRIEFEDTGEGIGADHVNKIFEPGFTTCSGNPGLGLAVCRTAVEQHRGTISVESVAGRGSIFSVILARGSAAA
jgi:signal transduction histidine kinase